MNTTEVRTDRDRIILWEDGADIDESIACFRKRVDGSWHIWESCDSYYGSIFTKEEMITFALHILKLCGREVVGR
jgi:hypothetical protein